jgi:16S rRNA (guanine527-N7)-methyltransferase
MTLDCELKRLIEAAKLNIAEHKRIELINYVALIHKWNKVHNLTAIRDEMAMLTLHIMDSLAVLPFLSGAKHVLDVGSGAGLPGIVIAICQPTTFVTVIDSSQKKASFMRQVKSELGLMNLTVLSGRVEQLPRENKFDVIISRAFSDLFSFISLTKNLCSENGQWIAMKGVVPTQEIKELKDKLGIQPDKIQRLDIPELNAERHLLFIPSQVHAQGNV